MAIDDIYQQEYLDHQRLKERRKFAMQDISGRNKDLVAEINWNKFVREKGYVKFSVGKEDVVVSRDHLWSILFMLGSAEEQEKMVSPFFKQTRVTKFTKMIGINTSRDVRKGEFINVLLEFTLNPETNQVTIGKGSMKGLRTIKK